MVDHGAGKMDAFKPHGTTTVGLRRFPRYEVMLAFAAVDALDVFHLTTSPAYGSCCT